MRPFRRSLWILVGGLVASCAALVAVNLLSGPRLTAVDVDTTAVVSAANARLVLATNRQLVEVTPEQISIEPAATFQVTTSANSFVISFPQPLAYNTDYSVSVRGVTGTAVDRNSIITAEFSTSEPSLYYLSRAAPSTDAGARAADRILRTTTGSADTAVAFTTPNIQQFVPIGSELAVATVTSVQGSSELTNALYRVDADGTAEALNLPGVGLVHDLQAAPGQSLLGFRFTSAADAAGPHYENVLFVLDLRTNAATAVQDLAGNPLSVTIWGFMAGRADIVARQYDSTLLLINPLDQSGGNPLENEPEFDPPVPLGQFANLTAFAPDGVRIAVSDRDGQYVLDLSQGTESPIVPQSVAGTTQYTAELRFLAGGDGYVQRVAEFNAATGSVRQYLSLVQGGEARTVYAPVSADETIVGFELSPNDQFLAVQIVPNRDTELFDGYPVNAQATEATTLFVNVATGDVRRSVLGFDATWQ